VVGPVSKSGVTVVFDQVSKVLAGVGHLASTRVLVGVPAEKAERKDGEGISNASLAYIHDKGAPEANIPARPFMEPGIQSAKAGIEDGLKKAGEFAFDARPEAVERQFQRVGTIARDAIKMKITDGPFAPLKPATIAARKRRGRTGTKPLIDTGSLRNSINYVVRKV